MRKGILVTLLALFTGFAMIGMVSCGGDDDNSSSSTTTTQYTITRDYNWPEGSTPTDSFKVNDGAKIPAAQFIPAPAKIPAGYELEDWFTLSVNGTKVNRDANIRANTTIFAHWTPLAAEDEAVITFNTGVGGSAIEPITITLDGTPGAYVATKIPVGELPSDPTRSDATGDFTFKQWVDEEGDPVDLTEKEFEQGNHTITAQWLVTLIFNKNDGTNTAVKTISNLDDGGTIAATDLPSPAPTWTGFTLRFWGATEDANTAIVYTTTYSSAVNYVYAIWEVAPEGDGDTRINFAFNYPNAPAGGIYKAYMLTDDDSVADLPGGGLPTPPSRVGYVFGDWYSVATGFDNSDQPTNNKIDWDEWAVSGTQTIYARWFATSITAPVSTDGLVEKVKLGNAAQVIYRFVLPDNAKFSDFEKISVTYRLDEASHASRIRYSRIYGDFSGGVNPLNGVYTTLQSRDYTVTTTEDTGKLIYNFNFGTYNNSAYQADLTRGNGNFIASEQVPVDAWFTLDYVFYGGNASWVAPNDAIRVLYFGVGISGNRAFDMSGDGNFALDEGVTQLIKDVTLVPKSGASVSAVKSTGSGFQLDTYASYYNNPGTAGAGVQGIREKLQGTFDDGANDPTRYPITFDFGHAGQASITGYFAEGQQALFMTVPVRDGFVFDGWIDGEDDPVDLTTWAAGTAAETLTATWVAEPGTLVTFDPGYTGSTPIIVNVPLESAITSDRIPTVTQTGYKFLSWQTGTPAADISLADLALVVPTAPITYTATWTAVTNNREVTDGLASGAYPTPGGNVVYTPTEVEGFTTLTLTLTLTRDSTDTETGPEDAWTAWRPMKFSINGGGYSDVLEGATGGQDPNDEANGDPVTITRTFNLPATASIIFTWNNYPTGASAPYSVTFDKVVYSYPTTP
jgi:uncharacterized repeat protein (TIGR02543 family)